MSDSLFGDKTKEIEQFKHYVNMIVTDQRSNWEVTPETYSVLIQDKIKRTFSKAELESFENQIKYLLANLKDKFNVKDINNFNEFLVILENIKNRYMMFNKPFSFVHDPYFHGYKKEILKLILPPETKIPPRKTDNDDHIIDSFNFGFKDFYSFGRCILNNKEEENDKKIFSALFNIVLSRRYDKKIIKNFKKEILFKKLKSFDPIKIGRELIKYVFKNGESQDYPIDKIFTLSTDPFIKLTGFLDKRNSNYSLLIVNVPKPAHTFHLIQASHFALHKAKDKPSITTYFCLPEKIIFCIENSNFQKRLNDLSNCSDGSIYYIVHPENLKSDEMQSLKSFISSRRAQRIKPRDEASKGKQIQTMPTVIVITSLPPSFFDLFQSNAETFQDFASFDENEISEFATFNSKWRSYSIVENDVFLFSSQQPGIGKTYHINKIIEKAEKNEFKDGKYKFSNLGIKSDHVYLDITTEEIPSRIKDLNVIHVSISPELFQNNFKLMDQLYLLITYGYFIFQNGLPLSHTEKLFVRLTFLIEIPNLKEENSLKHFYDFPIAPSNYKDFHESSYMMPINKTHYPIITDTLYPLIFEELEEVEDKTEFVNGHFHLTQNDNKIEINPVVKKLMKLVFKDVSKIKTYDNLIRESQKLFFPGQKFENENYQEDNRILSKVQKMLDDYSDLIDEQHKDDDEIKRILFLLAIRTTLYIWHFNSETSKNLILLVPQGLMTKKYYNLTKKENKENIGWIFVSFFPKNYRSTDWNTEKLLFEIRNDDHFKEICFEKFGNNELVHILTDEDSSEENDITLQARFFQTILLFISPRGQILKEEGPFQKANILLYLFSDLHRYPDDSFIYIMKNLHNKNYTLENCKNNFKDNFNVEWGEVDELLYYYLHTKSDEFCDKLTSINKLIDQLKLEIIKMSQESILNIIKMSFSKTYFCRFIEIILKISYHHFSILQGETGCGKTSVINLLSDILALGLNNQSIYENVNWSFFRIDFHGNFTQKNFEERMDEIETEKNIHTREKEDEIIIVFLDELNTSPAYYYVIDHIQNKKYRFFSYIAAINAKKEVSKITNKLSCVGIPQKIVLQLSNIALFSSPPSNIDTLTYLDENHYAYNVKEAQESVKSSIIMTDLRKFDDSESEFLPNEEKIAIRSIIKKILLQWKNRSPIMYKLDNVIKVLSELINNIFISVRSFMELRAVFSYRDVHRVVTIFTYVFDFLYKHAKKDEEAKTNRKARNVDRNNELKNKMTSMSIIISVYVSLICRFSHEKIEQDDEIDKRFENVGQFQKHYPFSMYELVLNYVQGMGQLFEDNEYPFFSNWEQISILFAYAKCMKYIYAIENESIYPLPSLMLHLLILSLTISASFHDINENKDNSSSSSFFTCLIIGMPGTSKSKAVEIYKKYHLKSQNKSKYKYFIATYMCSRTSDSDSLFSQFLNGASFLADTSKDNPCKRAIVILEEVGLANYNPSRPLKILHPLCDKGVPVYTIQSSKAKYHKVIPVQLSNYAIDFANMNRGFLVCAGLPNDNELSISIAFGKLMNTLDLKEDFSTGLIMKMLNDNTNGLDTCYLLKNYDDVINYLMNITFIDDDDFNSSIEEFNKNHKLFSAFLESLWKVTQKDGKRPDFFPMRPLFGLISLLSYMKKYWEVNEKDKKKKSKVKEKYNPELFTYLLNSFISDEKIIKKSCYNNLEFIKSFLDPLQKIEPSLSKGEEKGLRFFDPIHLLQSFDSNDKRKALLIRTKDYEAYRYLMGMLNDSCNLFTYNFVPFEFQDVGQDCQAKFENFFKYICLKDNEQYTFVSVGNDPFADYIIDILNVINHQKQCPTAILKGFPVYLPCFPDKIKFIFIINNSDINNQELKNPVPFPLIDRLDHIFLDKQILIETLKSLPKIFNNKDIPSEYDIYSSIQFKYLLGFAQEPENKNEPTKSDLLFSYEKSDFYYLLDALMNKNPENEILSNHFKKTSIKSLNDLLEKLSNNEFKPVVFTRTPFYEEFNFNEKKKFAIINDDHKNLRAMLKEVNHRKSIIIKSDIFIFPDNDTLNHAYSIITAIFEKWYMNNEKEQPPNINENAKKDGDADDGSDKKSPNKKKKDKNKKKKKYSNDHDDIDDDDSDYDKNKEKKEDNDDDDYENDDKVYNDTIKDNKYIIIFNLNENQIPYGFESFPNFPVVWIETLSESKDQKVPLIQEICYATFKGQIQSNSSIIMKGYERMIKDISNIIKKDYPLDTSLLFSSGIEFHSSVKKVGRRTIQNKFYIKMVDIIESSRKCRNTESDNFQSTLSFDEIKNNIVNLLNKIKEAQIYEDKIKYEKELNGMNLEMEFFRIVSNLSDPNISPSLYIIAKYLSKFAKKIKKEEDILSFFTNVFETVSALMKIVSVDYDSFSSGDIKNEINNDHPSLILYNILKPFISVNYFNSLNLMKKLLQVLYKENAAILFDYLNLNYFNFDKFPRPENNGNVTYNDFEPFFSIRGLIYPIKAEKKKNISSIKFITINGKGYRPNLVDIDISMNPIREVMRTNNQWKSIEYKKILLSDISSKQRGENLNAFDYPHPFLIYHHFVNIKDFSFDNYSEEKGRIFINQAIPWIIRFFLYGSFNDSDYAGLIKFIKSGLNYCIEDMEVRLRLTPELIHFLFDLLFAQFCGNDETKTIIRNYDFIDKSISFLQITDASCAEKMKQIFTSNAQVSTEIVSKELTNTDYDIYSNESNEIIKNKFAEIKEFEDVIKVYKEWKDSIEVLETKNIFDNVRSFLFHPNSNLDDQFGVWFLNDKYPLLNRQVYEVCKAIKSENENQIKREFNILKRLINPWSEDDRSLRSFWSKFVERISFESLDVFNSSVNSSLEIKYIVQKCQPYYICQHEEARSENPDQKVTQIQLLYRNPNIITFSIERLLYSLTILEQEQDVTQLFSFMRSIPFVQFTKHLYILAGFVNEIFREFEDQINLLFLILETSSKCVDLMNIEKFKDVIDDNKRTESREALKEALEAADKYSKSENAHSKLKSYINRLIDINNDTVIFKGKSTPQTCKYRIVCKLNLHSNMSLNNTFVPALAHLSDNSALSEKVLQNAFNVLTGDKSINDLICSESNSMYLDCPTIFTFASQESDSSKMMVKIEKIKDDEDLFGFNGSAMILSLCEELAKFLSNKENGASYRAKIWERIENETVEEGKKPDYAKILATLFPLFEEYDKMILDDHLFFSCDDWPDKETLPEELEGTKAAAHFIKFYKVDGSSIYQIVKDKIKSNEREDEE